jgi:hypothetical protein
MRAELIEAARLSGGSDVPQPASTVRMDLPAQVPNAVQRRHRGERRGGPDQEDHGAGEAVPAHAGGDRIEVFWGSTPRTPYRR